MSETTYRDLTGLLKETSRSFYLTLRVLPGKIRMQIGLAYLLARTTDTIADTAVLPVGRRVNALENLRDLILGNAGSPPDFGELARNQDWPAERDLLERCGEALALLEKMEAANRQRIRDVLTTIISGQELDCGASKRLFGGKYHRPGGRRGTGRLYLPGGGLVANSGRRCAGRICFPRRCSTSDRWK